MLTVETWKPIVGFKGVYEVSDLGHVRSLDRYITFRNRWGGTTTMFKAGQAVKPGPHTGGYRMLHLYLGGRSKTTLLHTAVIEAFVGPRPPGMEVLHNDGNKLNCRLDNLRYGTRLENERDKILHGTLPQGESHALVKLSIEDVLAIRKRVGEPQKQLADEYGCTFSNISAIQRRKSWRHV